MAQNDVLPETEDADTSSDIVVAAGAVVTVGIYTSDNGGLPGDSRIVVYIDTPGDDKALFELVPNYPVRVVSGPCTLRGTKPSSAVAYGMFSET